MATAVRILDFLSKQTPRAGVTEIARALATNKSTCFNILLTLAHFGVVVKLPGSAQYQLGPRLAELGGAFRRRYDYRDSLRRQFAGLVAETQLVCVIGQVLGDALSFVIIDQVAPAGPRSRDPAPRVGTVFPLTGPAMGGALLSCFDEDDAIAIVRNLSSRLTPADEAAWRTRLHEVRRTGYAASREQYKKGVNALAAPIKRAGEPYLVAALIAHPRDLSSERIDALGPRLAHAARRLGGGLRLAERPMDTA
ncbi:MAG: IclR family transcriptional regulator [Burkholderiales bacterium]